MGLLSKGNEGWVTKNDNPNRITILKAIINNCNPESKKYIIWDFEETLEYNKQGCFLNNKKVDRDPLELWQEVIDKWKKES